MTDVLFTPIRLNELEALIQNSVERAMKAHEFKQVESKDLPDQLLTIQQAAELLNLTVPSIYSKASRGELPVVKRSKRLYFSRTELLEYIIDGCIKSYAEIEAENNKYLTNNEGSSNMKYYPQNSPLHKRQNKNYHYKIQLKTIFYHLLKLIVNTLIIKLLEELIL